MPTYVCINCKFVWTPPECDPTEHHSAAICDTCFTAYVRAKQKSKGYHDCYKRSTEICSDKKCIYWQMCCQMFIVADMLSEEDLDAERIVDEE